MDAQVISSDPAPVSWKPTVLDYPTEPRSTEAIETLIYSVEELLWRLPAAADSEIARLRDQATSALAAARSAVAGNVARAETDRLATADLGAYVREWPRTALGVAVIFGLAIGLWSGRRGHRRGDAAAASKC